jgi:hypothetical protein
MSDDVTVSSDEGSTVVTAGAGGWTYEWSARKRPFLHPVATPSGKVLTRNAPEDHPWHHGVWFTIKFVNEENFWEEYDAYGVLRHTEAPTATSPDGASGATTVAGELAWIRPDRETVVIDERRSFSHVPLSAEAYAIDVDTTITPRTDVLLDRTPFTTWGGYGGLALRGRGDWTDTRLLLEDGEHERVLGDRSRWCDLSGTVDGATAGVTFLDHPHNPRHPVPWYGSTKAATYGDEGWSNFLNAAFLWDEPLPVAAGEALRFQYRVVVHDGVWDASQVQDAWDTYTRDVAW